MNSDLVMAIQDLDWVAIFEQLNQQGFVQIPPILKPSSCKELIVSYQNEQLFRKKVVMGRHDYGKGEYQYFREPLPRMIAQLREQFYQQLAPLANQWMEQLNRDLYYPPDFPSFREQCHKLGQLKPTPLLLCYEKGDFNRLHRDLYGDLYFPLQVVFQLNQPGIDFQGGEIVLVEQKPRSQSKASVVQMAQGAGVIFAANECPRRGVRGYRKLTLSHGVSCLHAGKRCTLGIIFHDAT